MKPSPKTLQGVFCCALLAAWASSGRAHVGHDVLRAERYLKVHIEAEGVRVVASLILGEQETIQAMHAADADGDGVVSQEEADGYMARWGEGLSQELRITIDGEQVDVPWGEPYFDPLGSIAPLPGAVEMIGRIPLDGGEHTLELRDGMQREKFDRTDVVFQVGEGAELKLAGPVGEASEDQTRFFFTNEPAGPESFEATFELPGLTTMQRWGIGGGGLATLVFAVLALRRRFRRQARMSDHAVR